MDGRPMANMSTDTSSLSWDASYIVELCSRQKLIEPKTEDTGQLI